MGRRCGIGQTKLAPGAYSWRGGGERPVWLIATVDTALSNVAL